MGLGQREAEVLACPDPVQVATPPTLRAECRWRFHDEVREVAVGLLGVGPANRGSRARRALLRPVLYTLERRRDYFPGAFCLAAGEDRDPDVARLGAAAVEIGWSCWAHILDDMLDRADERAGHPPAHAVYGYVRAFLSIPAALAFLVLSILRCRRLPARTRLAWLWTGLTGTVCGAWGLRPAGGACTSRSYAIRWGSAFGRPVAWALVAPLSSRSTKQVRRALRRYADLHGVNERLRNDLADYFPAPGEPEPALSDFHTARVTFPAAVLMEQARGSGEGRRVREHFAARASSRLPAEEATRLLLEHGVFELCLDEMRMHLHAAQEAIAEIERAPHLTTLARFLRRWEQETLHQAEAGAARATARRARSRYR